MFSLRKSYMLTFSLFCYVLSVSSVTAETSFPYTLTGRGVTFKKDSLHISVEVVDDNIFHVVKNTGQPQTLPDYVVTMTPQKVSWETEVIDGKLILSTRSMSAVIDSNGNIEYKKTGKSVFLSETPDGTFVKPNQYGTNIVSQAFKSGDEALYGLGQFQSGIMNWKHVPVRLDQFNQEVAVPFIVSTKGYGIYWNNYSMTYFNSSENEILFPKSVFHKESQNISVKSGQEIENVAAHKFNKIKDKNIREVTFVPEKTGIYTFFAESETSNGRMRGDVKVVIDNDTIINYTTVWVPSCFSGYKELKAGKKYRIVYQNTGSSIPGRLYYNAPDYDKTVFRSVSGVSIDYYVISGDSTSEILYCNHKLTGHAPLFPKKAYGFWQCRERYHSQKELLANARQMRARNIPVDIIIQDWHYWPDKTKGPEWNRKTYPDPKAMVDTLKSLNMDLLVSVWPEVKNTPLLDKYGLEERKYPDNSNLDFYSEYVRDNFYRMVSDSMFHIGVEGIWLDGTEPGSKPSEDVKTAVGPFRNVHNVYSLEVTRSIFEGMKKEYPGRRSVNLTRSAFTGQQRYGVVTWSGDVAGTWEQFSEQIPAGLNFTMSGIPYWTHDIGGFFRDSKSMNPVYKSQYTDNEYKELLTRWFQFGTFSPIFRLHGFVSQTEIWRYGKEFESVARKYIDLRYRLLPYIYSEAWKIYKGGHQLMSPLSYYFPDDKNVWNIKDQYFFGENIMVGIVTKYQQREKTMYLPQGDWFDFWSGKKYSGGKSIEVPTPLDSNPLLVRSGSIIPYGPKLQYATEKSDVPITLRIYPGKDAEYTLYYDDNVSTEYQNGIYSEITFSYSEKEKSLKVSSSYDKYLRLEDNPLNFKVEVIEENSKLLDFVFKGTSIELNLN